MSLLPKSGPGNLGLRFSAPAFFLGLLAAFFQIFLLREFSAQYYGNELTFGFVLAAWLFWGGWGSLWASKRNAGRAGLAGLFFGVLILSPLCFTALRFSRFVLGILPGEITGLGPAVLFALGLAFLINFPLGIAFVFTVKHEGNLPRVYLWESMGAASGGLLAYLALIPYFSNWHALAILGSITALAVFSYFKGKKAALLCIFALVLYSAFALFEMPSQRIAWKPFTLIHSQDSLYGKLQVIKTAEQITLYNNGLRVYSNPDWESAEEAVHFALLQNPQASRVLLIGGGAGGSLAEFLKYPNAEVDYVELDPEMIRLSERFLPASEGDVLKNSRIHIVFSDGRTYLKKTQTLYDVIILDLPEPATAQINRFYTREFFSEVFDKLNEGGVFSFSVPSAENYISPELQKFLSAMYSTLNDVFPKVKVIPGDSNIFLASTRTLAVDAKTLSEILAQFGIKNKFIMPEQLSARLHELRIRSLMAKIDEGPKIVNSDLHPVSYFFDSILWSTHLKGLESKILVALSGIPAHWLLDIPLLLFVGLLLLSRLKTPGTASSIIPLAVLGLTTMACEIMWIILYQTLYGYVYRHIALLLTTFMGGLAFGSFMGAKRKKHLYLEVIMLQFCLLMLVLAMKLSLQANPSAAVVFAFLFLLGYLGGNFFIVSNVLFFRKESQAGLGYGWDLLGSFVAAIGLSAILIPLAGLPILYNYLFLLNSFGLIYLVFMAKNIRMKGVTHDEQT